MAYRSRREQVQVQPAESGLVVDMVRQFADRYAFARELVQNAVDAGATHIDVRAELGPNGRAIISVHDDGEGMGRETIEGPLLTLFNSSKDSDRTKIGKYGVGFVSVFAIEPAEVVVESWRQGESWVVRLAPDHSYELAAGHEREGSGTTVTLVKPMKEGEFSDHVVEIGAALRRWCRHAGLPIRYFVPSPGAGGDAAPVRDERVDCPLTLATAISVAQEVDGEIIVVGPSAGADQLVRDGSSDPVSPSFAGFYNRGLTLVETTHPPTEALAGVHLKIQSPQLQHTLSRDDVRHDEAYQRVLRKAEEMVSGPLRRKLQTELACSAQRVAGGAEEDVYAALLAAACEPPLRLDTDEIPVPLITPVGGRAVMALDEALTDDTLYVSSIANDLTAALAKSCVPVVRVVHDSMFTTLSRRFAAGRVRHIYQAFLIATEIPAKELSPSDRRLCRALCGALQRAQARVERVGLAHTSGVAPPRGALAVPADGTSGSHLWSLHQASTWWTRWGQPPALWLAAEHEAVKRARGRAEYDPISAADLLARALLVEERGALGKRANDALLVATAAQMAPRRRRRS